MNIYIVKLYACLGKPPSIVKNVFMNTSTVYVKFFASPSSFSQDFL